MVTEAMDKKFNALKHGLLARQVVISPAENRPFNKIAKKLLAELQPESPLEMVMAEEVIINYWRLRRYLKLENELFMFINKPKYGLDSRDFMDEFTLFVRKNPSFDVLLRYHTTIYRSFYRSLHEFKNLKFNNTSNKSDTKLDES
jgi:hypothetical protein